MNPTQAGPAQPFVLDAEQCNAFINGVTDYAIYMLSPKGIVTHWNTGAQQITGYRAEEIIGRDFSIFYTAEERAQDRPAEALEKAAEHGCYVDEGWRLRKDSTRFWTNPTIESIYDNAGTLLGYTVITKDITDQKKSADALRVSDEQFRLLIQSVVDYAIYMLSVDGTITNWNQGAERIKGYDSEEVIGSHFSRFYTEVDRVNNLPMKALEIAARDGCFENEGWRVRKDGSRFWAHVVIDPVKNDLGELVGFAKVTRDITERRETTLALEKAQNALFQSQKLEAIGKLTGGIAHDFNNFLSVIVNGLSILRMSNHDEQGDKVLDSMERAANRSANLIRQLLTFARQQPVQQDRQNLNRVITSFEAVLRRANRSTLTFNLKLQSGLPDVMIDASQLEAGLLNLIVNAGDATPYGGSITLETSLVQLMDNEVNQLAAGLYVCVCVRDSGEGMSTEVAARALEPFYTTKAVGKGTGLGLSQVYGFMQNSSGDIKIESTPGNGTAICLYFPIVRDNEKDAHSPRKNKTEKALVVDDQPEVLATAVELFQSLGYEVFSANNGAEALDVLKRTPDIEVLFTDVMMPGMSGVDLAQKSRALIPSLKVILASGYTGLAYDARSPHADFQFIGKPYRI
jgi:PAS domain S-box-containing protein